MKKIYIVLLLTLICVSSFAQTYNLSGKVIDSLAQKPLLYANITATIDGRTPIKTTYTKIEGVFLFDKLKPGKYILLFSYAGYNTKMVAVDLNDSTQINRDLGTVYLNNQKQQLKEVVISASKPLIKQEVDRISYDLQADPESKINSVLDMLRKVPYVTLDANDNILLKGSTSYKILINGKPSSMMERDPVSILRSIPASTIQRIEIITTPPAKYDAEGLAGIINIITNKKVEGYSGTVNLKTSYPGGPGIGASFTVKEGKLSVSGYAGGNIYNQPVTTTLNTRSTTGATPTNLLQQGNSSGNGNNGYFSTELSYEIDSLKLVSGQFSLNGSRSNGNSEQASLLTGQSATFQGYNITNGNTGNGHGVDASLNYQLGFKANKSRLLTFSYRYYDYSNNNMANLATTNRVNYTTPDYNQDDHASASEQTVQVDFVQSVKKWNIEAGAKGIFRTNLSDFQYNSFNTITNNFLPDTLLSNKYNSTQTILAAYNSWQYKGKSWGIKGGLRLEQTLTNANFISSSTNVHQSYLDAIPSVAANWDFKDGTGLNIGYTQRINRPGLNRLNPFVDRSNPDFQSSGNPDLKPFLFNDITAGYHFGKKISINVGLVYDFGKGLDSKVTTFDPATNITLTNYQNIGSVSGLGNTININYPVTSKLSFSLNSNIMQFWISGLVNGIFQKNEFLTINIFSSAGYDLGNGWRVNFNVNIRGRNPTGLQGSTNGYTGTAFSVNKQIIKNKLFFSAAVNNLFIKYRTSMLETTDPAFVQTNINQVYFRSYSVSLNYNFGKLKEGVKKTRQNIRNDDGAN